MALGLARDGVADFLAQNGVIRMRPQRRAQIGAVFLTQAHVQFARAGHADPVAAFAEIMGHRRDEADLLPGFGQLDITGGAAGAFGQIQQGETFGQLGAQVRQRPILVQPILVAQIAHGHHFDEGQVVAFRAAPFHQPEQFDIVEALQGDGVDLDLQARVLCRPDAVQNLLQASPPGDLGEFFVVQRVQRHVHPAHAAFVQFGRVAGQLAAIGGQGQFVQTVA